MKTITLWSVGMSVFFSLSLTGSLYEAGRDHMEAAAGAAGVERTLGDFAGRMGLSAPPPSDVPAVSHMQIANRAPTAGDISKITDWVGREGHAINEAGKPVIVNKFLARDLGMDFVDWPAKQKAFGPENRPDITCVFQVAELNGRREFVVIRVEGSERLFWRVGSDGRPVVTVRWVVGVGNPAVVDNQPHSETLRRLLEGLLEAIPGGSRVG